MTKEKIIDIFTRNSDCPDGIHRTLNKYQQNKVADELLTLFNKELVKRLEQLHAEMDERMREEVAIEKRMGEKKAENLLNQIEELTTGKCALRCPLVEQEKKEQVKEFVEWLKERLKEQYTHLYNGEGSDIVRSIGVHIVMSNLDTHLEKFLDIENELAKK